MFVMLFVHCNLGEELKSELDCGVPLPWIEACSYCCTSSCLWIFVEIELNDSGEKNPNTCFLPHRCSAVKTFFLTLIKTFFFTP